MEVRENWKTNACILCECNCGIEVTLGGDGENHLVKLRGDKRHPVSQGYACEKAHRLDYYQHNPDRITQPLRKTADGTFEEISWDVAIREIAERFLAIKQQYGGETIFYYGGGGQGNHLPGAYATATRAMLGSRYRSNALAQEKTGEFWVSSRMMGSGTRADFEHCDVALFLGKNPWHSHSIPRARVTLKEIAKDPQRALIVIDPRKTETAALAKIHLQVKPATDAWVLLALLALLKRAGQFDAGFVQQHVLGAEEVFAVLDTVDVARCCSIADVPVALVEEAAKLIGNAKSFASFEDLGVQMNRNSTVVSYLHRLLITLTGSIGKPGTHYIPSTLVPFFSGTTTRKSPVVGATIVSGLVPCNVIAKEILSEHPKRYRAMLVESANPAHSLADTVTMKKALEALELLVVIDIAMSETAQLADYVLPAKTQFEKAEASFFNFEFPKNYFQLRPRLLEAPEGPLSEAEIHARLVKAMGGLPDELVASLRAASANGLEAYVQEFFALVMSDQALSAQAAVLLYRTLALKDEVKEGAVLLGLALRFALEHSAAVERAGYTGSPIEQATKLFEAMLVNPQGVLFADEPWEEVRSKLLQGSGKIQAFLPDLLESVKQLTSASPAATDPEFPWVLSAGERRAYTANTIFRDGQWRKKDSQGALRMHPADAAKVGVEDGGSVRLVTRRGSAVVSVECTDTMRVGHLALPNGLGLSKLGGLRQEGVAPNELTSLDDCDPWVGTPWHKSVSARLEKV